MFIFIFMLSSFMESMVSAGGFISRHPALAPRFAGVADAAAASTSAAMAAAAWEGTQRRLLRMYRDVLAFIRVHAESRAEEEKQFWAKRDPLKALERDLVGAGLVSADDLRAIEKEIDAEVQDCVDFALSAPEPDGSELTKYIWAED